MSSEYEKRVEELKRHLLNEYSLLPEFIDGLTSIHEGTEDYTCLTLKKIMGKRGRGKPAALLFEPANEKAAKEDCSSCPPG